MRILLLLTLLAAQPAQAERVFHVTVGMWTILSARDNCMAFNRPESEMGLPPVNALYIFAEPTGEFGLAMSFWPGAISEEDKMLTLRIAGQGSHDLPAAPFPGDTAILRATGALPEDLVAALKGKGDIPLYNVQVAPDVSDVVSLIDIQDAPRVMIELGRCRDLMQRAK
jgi:hypothetical protein